MSLIFPNFCINPESFEELFQNSLRAITLVSIFRPIKHTYTDFCWNLCCHSSLYCDIFFFFFFFILSSGTLKNKLWGCYFSQILVGSPHLEQRKNCNWPPLLRNSWFASFHIQISTINYIQEFKLSKIRLAALYFFSEKDQIFWKYAISHRLWGFEGWWC